MHSLEQTIATPGPCTPFPVDTGRLMSKVLMYEHPEIVHRLMKENGWGADEAKEVFADTLRFLFLCGTRTGGMVPTKRIDIGWHTFILYTEDYATFCHMFFGVFIHHRPTPKLAVDCYRACKSCFGKSCGHTLAPNQVDEGSLLNTVALARTVFGELSANWRILDEQNRAKDCEGDADNCGGSTNCQN